MSGPGAASGSLPEVIVRNTRREDFVGIMEVSREVYPASPAWSDAQLSSHLQVFPEGQFVAEERPSGRIVAMMATLIVYWDDYDNDTNWRDFTDRGMFTNHDPVNGRTLYGAEIMVLPSLQGKGIGKRMYAARRELVERLGLLRIRAGARLAGYYRYAGHMSAEEYTIKVVRGELTDPTLNFQLGQEFRVLAVVRGYLQNDPKSLGYAAVIEWLNPQVATARDYAGQDARFHPVS